MGAQPPRCAARLGMSASFVLLWVLSRRVVLSTLQQISCTRPAMSASFESCLFPGRPLVVLIRGRLLVVVRLLREQATLGLVFVLRQRLVQLTCTQTSTPQLLPHVQ